MPKGQDTRHHPNRKVDRPRMMSAEEWSEKRNSTRPNYFSEGKQSAVERQLPLVPGGLTESERNDWEEGYDYGETVVDIPSNERNVYPRGQ